MEKAQAPEEFDVMAFLANIEPISEDEIAAKYGTAEEIEAMSQIEYRKPGRSKGRRAFTNWRSQQRHVAMIEFAAERAPNPPKYFGGVYRYLPIDSCVEAMEATIAKLGSDGRQFRTRCLTCQEEIETAVLKIGNAEDGSEDEYVQSTSRMFGAASDHCREHMNHAVVVEHVASGLPLWMAPYSILKSQTEYVPMHNSAPAGSEVMHSGYSALA